MHVNVKFFACHLHIWIAISQGLAAIRFDSGMFRVTENSRLGAWRARPLGGQGKRARFSDSVVTAVDPGDGGASNQHKSQQSKTGINDPAIRLLRWL